MKTPKHVGNVTIVLRKGVGSKPTQILLGLKPPKNKADDKRNRKRVGADKWVPPGGGTESGDKSQKHAAQRELLEETGLNFSLSSFKKVGMLRGYNGSVEQPLWLVHIYLVTTASQALGPTAGPGLVKLQWFGVSRLPFNKMLTGDRDWIPRVIKGEKLTIKIVFSEDESDVTAKTIRTVRSFNGR